jgi:hypothetical protein
MVKSSLETACDVPRALNAKKRARDDVLGATAEILARREIGFRHVGQKAPVSPHSYRWYSGESLKRDSYKVQKSIIMNRKDIFLKSQNT